MRERSVYLMLACGLLVVAALAFFIRPLLVEEGKSNNEREARAVDVPDSTPTATVPAEFTTRPRQGDAPQPKGNWPAFQKQDGGLYASPEKPEGEAATP
ncbi:hypothetical protein [Rhizobium halophytocola]|uniref:Uncharacterized protein n=1 Tax=Rhizobium halophytocola TaxID=735519 RepID=A0ABS4DZI2_9HYPH|nr:hypothetical protein [Rhizobium halophytocola]MBP1851097.1 hypothetical protein [Rhizobium halophytocola]